MWAIIRDLHLNAKKGILGVFTHELRLPFDLQREIKRAVERGVKMKIIATKKNNPERLKESLELGCDLRYYPVSGFRVCIRDRKEALSIVVNPKDRKDRINIHVQSPELAKALSGYFYSVWEKAEEIKL